LARGLNYRGPQGRIALSVREKADIARSSISVDYVRETSNDGNVTRGLLRRG